MKRPDREFPGRGVISGAAGLLDLPEDQDPPLGRHDEPLLLSGLEVVDLPLAPAGNVVPVELDLHPILVPVADEKSGRAAVLTTDRTHRDFQPTLLEVGIMEQVAGPSDPLVFFAYGAHGNPPYYGRGNATTLLYHESAPPVKPTKDEKIEKSP